MEKQKKTKCMHPSSLSQYLGLVVSYRYHINLDYIYNMCLK